MFLESFQKDKNKALDWVQTFHEECENAEKHKEWAKKGYVTVPQALKERGLSLSDFKEHKQALDFVQEWWEENSVTFKTKDVFPVKFDKKDRILWHEFYFIFPQMGEHSLETADKKKLTGEGSVKSAKALEWAAGAMGQLSCGSSSASGNPVKLENPLWPTIQANKDSIASTLSKYQGEMKKLKTLRAKLHNHAKTAKDADKGQWDSWAKEADKTLKSASDHEESVELLIERAGIMHETNESKDVYDKLNKELLAMKSTAEHHLDGIKLAVKRFSRYVE